MQTFFRLFFISFLRDIFTTILTMTFTTMSFYEPIIWPIILKIVSRVRVSIHEEEEASLTFFCIISSALFKLNKW